MTQRPGPDDDVTVSLRRTLDAVDPVPADLLASGRAVFGLRRVDDELAALVADSLVDAPPVRAGGSAERVLSFTAGDVTIDVQLSGSAADRVALLGEVDPAPSSAAVVVDRLDAASLDLSVDAEGRFSGELDAGATMRLRLLRAGLTAVATPWFAV